MTNGDESPGTWRNAGQISAESIDNLAKVVTDRSLLPLMGDFSPAVSQRLKFRCKVARAYTTPLIRDFTQLDLEFENAREGRRLNWVARFLSYLSPNRPPESKKGLSLFNRRREGGDN